MLSRTGLLALPALALHLAACNSQVIVGSETCGDPPPPSGGYCPPAWTCIDGQWVDTAGACPEPPCPEYEPVTGDSCEVFGQSCTYYEDIPCGPSGDVQALCTANGWSIIGSYCQPEPECPLELPAAGTDCTAWTYAYGCTYPLDTACGASTVGLSCNGSTGLWQVDAPAAACDCALLEPGVCGLVSGCQWLEPGCSAEPVAAGCYPTLGCDVAESCPLDTACVERSYDPCFGAACDACSAPYFLCEPTLGG